ncbi:MAG TPA: MFS transporter [Gaiellaceae bacterium]|nr:MFS transporter [Gaiellaceae bacterium]
MRLTLLHDQPLVDHFFHPSGRRGLGAEVTIPAQTSRVLPRRARRIVLAAAATVSGLFALDSTVISVALPAIRDDLGGGSATIEWVSSVYLLTFAVTLLPAGRMVDRYGARRMFLSGVAVYVAAAFLGALAAAPWMLILGRGAQGVGAGIVGPSVLVLVTDAFGAERRGWAIGLFGMLLGGFSAAGPLVGGIFTDTVGWQAIFVVHGVLAAAAAALVARTVPHLAGRARLPLLLGSTAALAGVVLGVQVSIIEGRRLGWEVGVLFVALAVASALVLWRRERGRTDRVLDFAMLRIPTVAASAIARSVVSFSFYGNLFYLTLFLESSAGYSAFQTGLILLPSSIAGVAVSPFVGRVVDRTGPGSVMALGTAVAAAGLFALALADNDSSVAFHLAPALVLNGLGYALVSVAAKSAPLGAVPDSQHGRVTSLVSFVSRVASGFGVTFATGVFHLLSGAGVARALSDRQLPDASGTADFVRDRIGVGDLQAHLKAAQVKQAGFPDVPTAVATVDAAFEWIFAGTLFVLGAIVVAGGAAIGLLLLRSRPARP